MDKVMEAIKELRSKLMFLKTDVDFRITHRIDEDLQEALYYMRLAKEEATRHNIEL